MMEVDGGVDVGDFLKDDFSVESCASKLLASGVPISVQLNRLATGTAQLDKQLRDQISSHHGKLLRQATSIESLESIQLSLNQHVSALNSTVTRVRIGTDQLYARVESQTHQLAAAHDASNLMRATIRVLQLGARLRPTSGAIEIIKRSQIVAELRELIDDVDLSGIDCIEPIIGALPNVQRQLIADANSTMIDALRAQHHAAVGSAIQVFINLKCVDTQVDLLIAALVHQVEQVVGKLGRGATITSSSDKAPGGSTASTTTPNSAAVRANLWIDVQLLIDSLTSAHSQLDVLAVVMSKKRSSAPAQFDNADRLSALFCTAAAAAIDMQLKRVTGAARQALENEYPRLLRMLASVIVRFREKDAKSADELRSSFSNLQTAYLSKSLSRLFDSVNLAFADGSIPSNDVIQQIVKKFVSELNAVQFDTSLLAQISHNIAKTIQLIGVKCEQLLSTDGDASQVIDRPSVGQKRNSAVINALSQLHECVLSESTGLLGESPGIIDACDQLDALIRAAIQPLMQSIDDAIAAIIATVHAEDFSDSTTIGGGATGEQCSLYMRELQAFVSRVAVDHLQPLRCRALVVEFGADLARKACHRFLLHTSLIRPVGESGRMRMLADFAQMEMAISPLCRPADIGTDEYAVLRAVRALLLESDEQLVANRQLGTLIPFWLPMHLLISRADDEFPSPHRSADWSVDRYADWFEQHPRDIERLAFLRGTCDAYAKFVSGQNKTEYVRTYPLLIELLKRGFDFYGTTTQQK